MLVLSRHRDEAVIIRGSGEIRVRVLEIRGDRVRIGFEADREVSINREEVQEIVDRENRAGARGDGDGGPRR